MTDVNPKGPEEDRRPASPLLSAALSPVVITLLIVTSSIVSGRAQFSLDFPWTTWVVLGAGPLLAFVAVLYTAFRLRGRTRAPDDGGKPDQSVVGVRAVGWAGLILAAFLGASVSLRTPVWIFVLVLESLGVVAILAAAELSTRGPARRTKPPAAEPEEPPEDPNLAGLHRDVVAAARTYHRSARRWAQVNYTLGFLTALFAGGSGVTGLSSASGTLKTVFAILAVVGAALTSLATTLKTSESYANAKLIADKLDVLAREIRWSVSLSGPDSSFKDYVKRFNELTTTSPQAPTPQPPPPSPQPPAQAPVQE
ncbi:hypothetical protein AB0J40_46710 [Amycolatopsis sp. NPDC049691]|uniref:hypothetical protein n=1 Tax=Amycolatopsis sp. NPDC049691 TaxID=3155155 RepID=UPI00341D8937